MDRGFVAWMKERADVRLWLASNPIEQARHTDWTFDTPAGYSTISIGYCICLQFLESQTDWHKLDLA